MITVNQNPTKAQILASRLTVISKADSDLLLEISKWELQANTSEDFKVLEEKIKEFKSGFALTEDEWENGVDSNEELLDTNEVVLGEYEVWKLAREQDLTEEKYKELPISGFDSYINDLEKRCSDVNFTPYDDRVPKSKNERFVWDVHTINLAENWLREHSGKNVIVDNQIDKIDVNKSFCECGIENNKSWVKIENEEDLPNETAPMAFWTYDGVNVTTAYYRDHRKSFTLAGGIDFKPTHYKPITKPQPPIY